MACGVGRASVITPCVTCQVMEVEEADSTSCLCLHFNHPAGFSRLNWVLISSTNWAGTFPRCLQASFEKRWQCKHRCNCLYLYCLLKFLEWTFANTCSVSGFRLFIMLFIYYYYYYKKERHRYLPTAGSISNACKSQAMAGNTQDPGTPSWSPTLLSHHLLLAGVCTSRNLGLEAEPGFKPRTPI